MANACRLTTVDNPYDPFEEFTSWFLFDVLHGYNTCSRLAQFSYLSDQLSQSENNIEEERAIDEIIKYDPTNMYRKVRRKSRTPVTESKRAVPS